MPALPGARDSQVERYAFVDHVRSRKIFTQENIFLHLKSSISIRLPHLEFMNNKQYYVTLPDKAQEGPYDEKDLIARYQAGKYPKGALVWHEGMDSWILIETMMSNVERITNDERRTADCKPNTPPLPAIIPPPPPSIPDNFKKEYYVADYDGNKQGPYSLDELKNSVKTGKLYGSELGWKQGMTDWVSLEDILDTRPVTYYMEPQSWVACSFFCASSILSIALTIAFSERSYDAFMICRLMCRLTLLTASILLLIRLFKAWKVLQNISARIRIPSPGQAIGFLFIPLFNFYWGFVAFCKISSLGNKLLKRPGSIQLWPFLTYCILNILGFIVLVASGGASSLGAVEHWLIVGNIISICSTACAIFVIYYINKLIFKYNKTK
jgi:hypothetical protein